MRRLAKLLPGLFLILSLAACGSDSSGPPLDSDGDGVADTDDAFPNDPTETTDTDRDGIGDNADPTPAGSTKNRLNSVFSGGAALVVAQAYYDPATGVENPNGIYSNRLDYDCAENWVPQGALCDNDPTTDDPNLSTKLVGDSGATWEDVDAGAGVLVVDACNDSSCAAVDFNQARVFQMYSDGKTTHVRISIHPERGGTPPAWDDAGWQPLTGFEEIGGGRLVVGGDPTVVKDPTVLELAPSVARYVRIEAMNDGALGSEGYIELRCVKLFSVPLS